MAHARTPLDGRNAEQKSKHAALPSASMGLEGLRLGSLENPNEGFFSSFLDPGWKHWGVGFTC